MGDVVLHLAQTDDIALASATGRYENTAGKMRNVVGQVGSIDDGAARMVEYERGLPKIELLERWSSGAARVLEEFNKMDLSTRVMWVAGEFSARTLATTRLAETWIHTGDIAGALGIT